MISFEELSVVQRESYYLKTFVKKSVSIGANATIVCGVTIGEYSMIGSGTVVTRDIPPFSLVIGNPGCLNNQRQRIPLCL